MKKINFLLALILISAVIPFKDAMSENRLRLINARGKVNVKEIGGKGLYVFSIWGKKKNSFIDKDGNFETIISDSRPQKLSVRDENERTRALTIALPKDSQNIFFDAKSTAAALLFNEPELISSSAKVEELSRIMIDYKSFQDLVIFLKSNLVDRPIEELMNDPQYSALLEECDAAVLGEDTHIIKQSLYDAKDKLEKLLKEK